MSGIFSQIGLPFGYLVLILIVTVFILGAYLFLDSEDNATRHALDLMILLSVYGLIFWISAFGIVWYGVVIYFLLIALLGYGLLNITTQDITDDEETLSIKGIFSLLFLGLLGFYFVGSAFPHSWKNLMTAGYNEYKYNVMGQDASIFTYRSDYITSIATMNLKDPHLAVKNALSLAKTDIFEKNLTSAMVDAMSPKQLHEILMSLTRGILAQPSNPEAPAIQQDINTIGNALYKNILYPTPDQENTK